MTLIRSRVIGCGSYLPENIVTNTELSKTVDTSDTWIVERTGIQRRHMAAEGELTSDLAIHAAKGALEMAGLQGDDIDMVIVATATPDLTFPATAAKVQADIGMTQGFAFDLHAVCSGFIYGLSTADNFIKAGQVKRALVIGAETFSRILDWKDRTSCVLFGDGAGAMILEAHEVKDDEKGTKADRGIISTKLHSDGRLGPLLTADGGVSSTQTAGYVRMQGREVFRHAVVNLAGVVSEVLEGTGYSMDDVDWLVPHQANKRILDGTAKKLGIDPNKVVVTVQDHANTSAASVPLAYATAVADGRIGKGDLVLMEAMGAGFTWGACLLRA